MHNVIDQLRREGAFRGEPQLHLQLVSVCATVGLVAAAALWIAGAQ